MAPQGQACVVVTHALGFLASLTCSQDRRNELSISILCAAILAGIWALVHLIIGGRQVERSLAADRSLEPVVRETMLYCWHLVTGFLMLMTVFLGLGAWGNLEMALAGTLMATSTAAIGIVLAPMRKISYVLLPEGWLFVPIAVLGCWGLMA
mgnify:CR=1 FL=1